MEQEQLRNSLIASSKEYHEGDVYVFEQPFVWNGSGALTMTALGIYEAEVDGDKLGDQLFAPGYTYYPKDLYYQKYDLSHLSEGEHILRVYLAQGWYSGRFTFENKTKIYGETTAVGWVLTSGKEVYKSTDDTVQEMESPYEYAGFYDGEIYHAGNGVSKSVGKPVRAVAVLPEHLEETSCAVRMREEMPIQAVHARDGVTILDFGQNFAGVICIHPKKMQGDCLKLRHGEILNPDGTLYTTNLRKAKAEIVYHKGETVGQYRPRFTYMGFRYVELSGVPYEEGLLTAYAVYSDMKRTGTFSCGNPLVQRLYENQVWGQKSNYVEVPTDCPQRDERMGYTGDGHVFALTGAYNYDTRSFWKKFLKDIRYSQMDNSEGYVGPTIPAQGPAGVGFMAVTKILSERGITTPSEYKQMQIDGYYTNRLTNKEHIWSRDTVTTILKNEVYIGNMVQHKREIMNYKTKECKKLPKSEWITIENTHEPIIDKETFNLVQSLIADKKRVYFKGNSTQPDNYFSGLLICGDCNTKMTYVNDKNRKYTFYKCKLKSLSTNLCKSEIVKTQELAKVVLKIIQQFIKIACDIEVVIKELAKTERQATIKSSYEPKNDIELQKELLYQKYRNLEISLADYKRLKQELEEKEVQSKSIKTDNVIEVLQENKFIKNFTKYKNIKSLNKIIVKDLIQKIIVHTPTNIEITFNFQDEYKEILKMLESK